MVLELAVSLELVVSAELAAAGLVFVGLAAVSLAGEYSALLEVVPDTYKAVLERVSRLGRKDG